jgi:sugar phosphate isomerase/epimerase
MRLGGPIFDKYETPREWVAAVKSAGYRAAYCPVGTDATAEEIEAYSAAARAADIVIAEMGAWSNPLGPDEAARKADVEKCKKSLALADKVDARCCVNIAGSRGSKWDGPYAEDLTEATFEKIVEVVRDIIDSVKPRRSFYTLETMPWMYPDSADSYLDLIRAIDRKSFAVHFDPANLINCPDRYFRSGEVIRDFVAKLGPLIKSCHAKDILLDGKMTTHLDEVRPGCGGLDYGVLLVEMSGLGQDVPVMLEHLPDGEEYVAAAAYVRRVADGGGLTL